MTDEDFRRQFGLTNADMADLNQLVDLMPDATPPRRWRDQKWFWTVLAVVGVLLGIGVAAVAIRIGVALY